MTRTICPLQITFETLDILGRARTTSLPMAELTRSDAVRPFTTWRTVPSKETRPQYFFVHEDLFRSRNEQLLVKLLHSAKEG